MIASTRAAKRKPMVDGLTLHVGADRRFVVLAGDHRMSLVCDLFCDTQPAVGLDADARRGEGRQPVSPPWRPIARLTIG
jgi:hypothetical protein